MKIIANKLFLFCIIIILVLNVFTCSGNLSELNPYLKKTVNFQCFTLDKAIPLNIYFHNDSTGVEGAEAIVYVMNHSGERIGTESDLSILRDYIQKGFIVITADFQNDPRAFSPHFDRDLHSILRAVYGQETESLLKDVNLIPKKYRCFFLPEGYRVDTHLVYWDRKKYGAYGTLEWVMETYNRDIVPEVPGLKPVKSPEEMVDREGNPFDYTVKMDIVYPSGAKKKLPLIFYSATQTSRNPNGDPRDYRPHMAGFTMRGYVYCLMGHCYNPCVNHFFHYHYFELDHWNGLACYTAAMRYLRMNAEKYFIDTDHIGGIGHSKGQYAITRLSDPNHANGKEKRKYEGFPEGSPEPQPWQGYSSQISAGYQSMGMGTFVPEYITSDYVPTIIACGENERDVISKEGYPAFVKRLEELDVNYIDLFMQGLAHEIPYGYDQRMGVDRYKLFHDFFDRYLKVDEHLPPVVLIVSPCDNKNDVQPSDEIYVQFAPVINEKSILEEKGIKIMRKSDNTEVDGSWKVSRGGTKYTFSPGQPLMKNEQYKIIVTRNVRDKAGNRFKNEETFQFTVAAK